MVQEKSLKALYDRCNEKYLYVDGKLYFKGDFHSKQRKGQRVGTLNNSGYLKVCLDYKNYLVHRLIFLMHHGYLPDVIDHIDQNKLNNKIENLRHANQEINTWNRGKQANNTSGYRGVSWNKHAGKWHAYIKVKGHRHHLGLFEDIEEARLVYEQARVDFRTDEMSAI